MRKGTLYVHVPGNSLKPVKTREKVKGIIAALVTVAIWCAMIIAAMVSI